MNFSSIFSDLEENIRKIPAFNAPFPVLDQEARDFNTAYNTALQTVGACLIVVYDEGEGDPSVRRIDLDNTLLVCVVVNPIRYTAAKARDLACELLRGLHHAERNTEPAGRHRYTHGQKAVTRGEMDAGYNVYYVSLRIKSLDTLSS